MKLNTHYRLGLRAVKTAMAVSVCLFISVAFNRDAYFLSAFAAIICMQPTYDQTFSAGLDRLFGTIVGGLVGYLLLQCSILISWYNNWWNILFAPLCLLLVIYICNTFYQQPSVSIACIVMLCIIAQPDDNITDVLVYAINRVIDTSIGIVIAMLINKFIYPKDKMKSDLKDKENKEDNKEENKEDNTENKNLEHADEVQNQAD